MIENVHITKKEFLEKHNKLSPPNLKATFSMLTRFQQEKNPNLKDDRWSIYKLRAPFITWLISFTRRENKEKEQEDNQPEPKNRPVAKGYRNYPETHKNRS